MPIVTLNSAFLATGLRCPEGKRRIEFVSDDRSGLYVAVCATSPGKGTFHLRYSDATGKTCHENIGRTTVVTLAEARKKAKELRAQIHLGADPRGEHKARLAVPTMTTFFDEQYLPWAKSHKRSWKKDVQLFKRVGAAFGDKRLNEMKRQEIQTFHASLAADGLSPASADHGLKLIRQMLNKAVEWEVLTVNPVARVKLFNADNRVNDIMEPEELDRLVRVLQTDKNRTVCNVALFLLSTGARLNEALGAKWEHIDRTRSVWRIPAQNSKSKRSRSVPLNEAALGVLDTLGTEGQGGFLFVSPKTKEHLANIHKVWDRLRVSAGLPKLRIHSLRHAHASLLINGGRTLYEVQKILGHSSHSVTERYAHLSLKSLMEASNTVSLVIKDAMKAAQGPAPSRAVEVQAETSGAASGGGAGS